MAKIRMLANRVATADIRSARPADDLSRPGARARGYDGKWDLAAAEFKASHPYCRGCLAFGIQRRTEVVDHVDPHRGDHAKFWNASQWQAACRWHHDKIKKRLEAAFERGEIGVSDLWLDSAIAIDFARDFMAGPGAGQS
jgi:5-methylcytosine-specific restriction protein A